MDETKDIGAMNGVRLDERVVPAPASISHAAQLILHGLNRYFPTVPHPTWTAVGVNWLASFDFEIKVIARPSEPALM